MAHKPYRSLAAATPVLMNCGCGLPGSVQLPGLFNAWKQVRVDIDQAAKPDILADVKDLSVIPSGSADAIWSAHCMEHLFGHEVVKALSEFWRVLRDGGFVCIIVPDLQTVSRYVASDRLHEVLYQSKAGPITAHDVIYGLGVALASGRTSMAHRSGFTPTFLLQCLRQAGFGEVALRRRTAKLELAAVASKRSTTDQRTQRLLDELGL